MNNLKSIYAMMATLFGIAYSFGIVTFEFAIVYLLIINIWVKLSEE